MTPFDLRTFARCLGTSLALAVLAWAIMLNTDTGMQPLEASFVRLCLLSPVLGTTGFVIARTQMKARGEFSALTCIGASPTRIALGALTASVAFGIAGAIGLAMSEAELGALFPTVEGVDWQLHHDGGWLSEELGIVAGPSPFAMKFVSQLPGAPHEAQRLPAILAVLVAAPAVPLWMNVPMRTVERAAVGATLVGAIIVWFHIVGAKLVAEWTIVLAAVPLLVHTGLRWIWKRSEGGFQSERGAKSKMNG